MLIEYADRATASAAAADIIEAALAHRLREHDEASLILSGGNTPRRTFEELASRPVPWQRVRLTMTDERWVPPDHGDSNERQLRDSLMRGAAAKASLLSLYRSDESIEQAQDSLASALRELPLPFACALVGMGEDGHFASIFPDAANLDELLDADGQQLVMAVTTDASPHPRMTLTLAALSRSDEIVLLVFGAAKRQVLDDAMSTPGTYPVSALLRQKRAPVRVLYAP